MKITEVVSRTGIDRWTAQYVLKRPDVLDGMPQTGSQGVHRLFDVDQALRLAICTDLIKGGLSLEASGVAVGYCEKQYRGWPGLKAKGTGLFDGSLTNPWMIEVLNHDLVLLCKRKSGAAEYHVTIGQYFSPRLNKFVVEEPDVIRTRFELDVTATRRLLTDPA